ncbi:hypothetical protein [Sagittula sp. S175]|uniref:hypothetical protein n=1 Tax=Sagittula sp. S175 TaxID=3415129 RepID=UPI003C79ACC4
MRVLHILILPLLFLPGTLAAADPEIVTLNGLTVTLPALPWNRDGWTPSWRSVTEGQTEGGSTLTTATWHQRPQSPANWSDRIRLTLETPSEATLTEALTDLAAPYGWACDTAGTEIHSESPDRLNALLTCFGTKAGFDAPEGLDEITFAVLTRRGDILVTLSYSARARSFANDPDLQNTHWRAEVFAYLSQFSITQR